VIYVGVSANHDEEFTEYVSANLGVLRRLAYLLCQDPHRVDDLVQTAITRLYLHWGRARAVDHLDAYTRTILVRVYLRDRQSRWATKVDLHADPPEATAPAQDRDGALDVRAAVAALPPRQRATLVLRYYCDLSVEQTAELLGCSSGTVKSQAAKALGALRRTLGPEPARRNASPLAGPEGMPCDG
jgi:RNA polymerase sigma-70 factor (sigma-E family)